MFNIIKHALSILFNTLMQKDIAFGRSSFVVMKAYLVVEMLLTLQLVLSTSRLLRSVYVANVRC